MMNTSKEGGQFLKHMFLASEYQAYQ